MPRDALEPQEVGQRARARSDAEGVLEEHRMEGSVGAKNEGGDTVLDRLWRVLVYTRLHQPLWVLLGLLHAEAWRAEQLRRLEHAALRAHYLGRLVDLAEKRLDRPELRLRHKIALVDQNQIGELDLVAEKMRDGALVTVDLLPPPIDERVHRDELLKD
eukprot:scaffold54405_cov55-Phaeocystis_antarctica.AAC.3